MARSILVCFVVAVCVVYSHAVSPPRPTNYCPQNFGLPCPKPSFACDPLCYQTISYPYGCREPSYECLPGYFRRQSDQLCVRQIPCEVNGPYGPNPALPPPVIQYK